MQDGVLRDARYVIRHFCYTNPYDLPKRGIMTYSRARYIIQNWHTQAGSMYLSPYLTRYRLHGTTIPVKDRSILQLSRISSSRLS